MTNSQTENATSEAELENLLRRINALTTSSDSGDEAALPASPPPSVQEPPLPPAPNVAAPSAFSGQHQVLQPAPPEQDLAAISGAPQPPPGIDPSQVGIADPPPVVHEHVPPTPTISLENQGFAPQHIQPQAPFPIQAPPAPTPHQAAAPTPSPVAPAPQVVQAPEAPQAIVPPPRPAPEPPAATPIDPSYTPAAPPANAAEPPTVQAPEPDDAAPKFIMPKIGANSGLGQPSTVPGVFGDSDKVRDKDLPFIPREPGSFEEAKINETEIEQLVLKFLFVRGEVSGRGIAAQICLPFGLLENLLARLKQEQLVGYKSAATMNDYVYILSDLGRERARRFLADGSYCGSATVSLDDYVDSVRQQSLGFQSPSREDLLEAFSDLLINENMFSRLGPAINSGRGMFLFGYPGNGKTSIAERITQCFGKYIYIPRVIGLQGEIVRVYDPNYHELVPEEESSGLLIDSKIDKRWVRIKRPTVVVGGELTMAQLELQYNGGNGTNEAPIQLKSNCGTLVIDDFGRQKMSTDELLNRWIVPLEKRYDFLNLPSGKSVQLPFDQLVVFSTNLEPRDLVDDAFLRRIPYKIEVLDPTEEEFVALFQVMCPLMGFEYDETAVRYVIDKHYKPIERPFRCCQPRDLLLQIKNRCLYSREPLELSTEGFDFAVDNYFAVM